VLERAACLVFRIEVEQREWNFISFEPLSQGNHEASLADSALTAHGEDDAFVFPFGVHRDPP
jgi:hypothetical protein